MNDHIQYRGHRARLRERFEKNGIDGFHDYEVLELLLTYGIPRRDVKPLAKILLQRFKNLSGVLNAPRTDLLKVQGLGLTSVTLIQLVRAVSILCLARDMDKKSVLASPQSVIDFSWLKISGQPHEVFLVIYLDVQNQVMGEKIINEGTVNQVAVYPRRIVEGALDMNASGLILVHNHPSGVTLPSEEDKHLTQAIQAAGKLFDIAVVDHLIVSPGGHFSFAAEGIL